MTWSKTTEGYYLSPDAFSWSSCLRRVNMRMKRTTVWGGSILLLTLGFIGMAVVMPIIQTRRERNHMSESLNNLKYISLAMHHYHDKNGRFPPHTAYSKDEQPLYSWRVLILPYLDIHGGDNCTRLYKRFKLDEPWDGDHNRELLSEIPKVFAPLVLKKSDEAFSTYYQVFVGKGTAFERRNGVTIASFTDGTSDTLLVVEGGEPVPWTKPQDLTYDPELPLPKLGGQFRDHFGVVAADGSVHFLPKQFDEQIIRGAITRNGKEEIDLWNYSRAHWPK
jgi:hypothetical protein